MRITSLFFSCYSEAYHLLLFSCCMPVKCIISPSSAVSHIAVSFLAFLGLCPCPFREIDNSKETTCFPDISYLIPTVGDANFPDEALAMMWEV